MEYFEYTLDLSFYNERNANIGNKPFALDEWFIDWLPERFEDW